MKVFLDASFINRFEKIDRIKGNGILNLLTILKEIDYEPCVVRYIYDEEILSSTIKKEIDGKVEIIDPDFIGDDFAKERNKSYIIDLYEKFCETSELINGKPINKIDLRKESNVFHPHHLAKSSYGDVLMIVLSYQYNIPIIFAEDKDFDLLNDISKEIFDIEQKTTIYSISNFFDEVISKNIKAFKNKELKDMKRKIFSENT